MEFLEDAGILSDYGGLDNRDTPDLSLLKTLTPEDKGTLRNRRG